MLILSKIDKYSNCHIAHRCFSPFSKHGDQHDKNSMSFLSAGPSLARPIPAMAGISTGYNDRIRTPVVAF
jgi:hypothetical protein